MVITGELRGRIDEEIARFPDKRGALLSALHAVQAEHGCVSPELASGLAPIFDVHPVEVMELVTFYNMFHEVPHGRHEVRVCTNLSCALRGANGLLRGLASHLGLDLHANVGETTSDGRIHLGREECLGACAYAPMMRIGDVFYEDLDLEAAQAVVDALE